jgi:hypothetical protein
LGWDLPILGNRRIWAKAEDWQIAESRDIVHCLNMLKDEYRKSPSEKLREQIAYGAQAFVAANSGQEVWMIIRDEGREAYFATGPRFVPEEDWDLNLDELISDGSYIVMESGIDYDLFDGEPFAEVLEGLLNEGLMEIRGNRRFFDSFANEDEVQSSVTCALEAWDMDLSNKDRRVIDDL